MMMMSRRILLTSNFKVDYQCATPSMISSRRSSVATPPASSAVTCPTHTLVFCHLLLGQVLTELTYHQLLVHSPTMISLNPFSVKKSLNGDLTAFLNGKDYYWKVRKEKKHKYLLFGPPGTGKTGLIAAMANFLNYNIYNRKLSNMLSSFCCFIPSCWQHRLFHQDPKQRIWGWTCKRKAFDLQVSIFINKGPLVAPHESRRQEWELDSPYNNIREMRGAFKRIELMEKDPIYKGLGASSVTTAYFSLFQNTIFRVVQYQRTKTQRKFILFKTLTSLHHPNSFTFDHLQLVILYIYIPKIGKQ